MVPSVLLRLFLCLCFVPSAAGARGAVRRTTSTITGNVSCDMCPPGQRDSSQCKDMFTAWMLGVSLYNAIIPGVPVDLAFCCACMTMRFFGRPADLTALGSSDAQAIFNETPEVAAATLHRLRSEEAMRLYKATCQRHFGILEKISRYSLIQESSVTEIRSRVQADNAEKCRAMEELHPEYAYLWAEEVLTEACPTLVPYLVELELTDNASVRGLPISAQQRQQLRAFVANGTLLSELGERDVKDAGSYLAERLYAASAEGVFGGWEPVDSIGMMNLETLKTADEEPMIAEKTMNDVDLTELDDLLDYLQGLHEKQPKQPVRDLASVRKHLRVLRLLRHALQRVVPRERYAMLRCLDPLRLLYLPGGEDQLLGLRVVGFRLPGTLESRSVAYSSGSSGFFSGVIAFASTQGVASLTGATIGNVALPVLGAVGGAALGTLIGAGAGLLAGGTLGTLSKASTGTIILQGWRVVVGSKLLGKVTRLRRSPDKVDDFFIEHLADNCAFYATRDRFSQPSHSLFSTPWSPSWQGRSNGSEATSGGREFWQDVALSAGIARELYFEDDTTETQFTTAFPRRAGRQMWLKATAHRRSRDWRRLWDRLALSRKASTDAVNPASVQDKNTVQTFETVTPLFGDMPDECWREGIGPALKKLWDSVVGTNGRGLLCRGVSQFLSVGVGGARALLFDPLRPVAQWASDMRSPTFWYERHFRSREDVSGHRMVELLQKARGPFDQGNPAALGVYVLRDDGQKELRRIPIYAYLIRLEPQKKVGRTYNGPRIGAATSGEAVHFYEVVMNDEKDIFLRTRWGWLAPCRKVTKQIGEAMAGILDNQLKGGEVRCLAQLEGNPLLESTYKEMLANSTGIKAA